MDRLLLGFEVGNGKEVYVPPFHTCIVGQTQFSGKTTTIKAMIERVIELGYKVLVFDTKSTEEEYSEYPSVPLCFKETRDPLVLIGLLESIFRRKITPYYATLGRLTDRAKNFQDIIRNAQELEVKTKSSFVKDACYTLADLLSRLKRETEKLNYSEKLELPYPINRMAINFLSNEAQQLIVKNSFEEVLYRYRKNVILVLDEAFKFVPEGYSSACRKAIQDVITQGARTGLYVYLSTQFLAPTDKDPLKAMALKILGTQDHTTEVKHTLDLIPHKRFKPEDIMTLKKGHFIVVTKDPPQIKLIYILPKGIPENIGKEVALGKLNPEKVWDYKPKVETEELHVLEVRLNSLMERVRRLV